MTGTATARPLTARQLQILQLAADGLIQARIAGRLGVTRNTVVSDINHACRALGADGTTHAVAEALRQGLIS